MVIECNTPCPWLYLFCMVFGNCNISRAIIRILYGAGRIPWLYLFCMGPGCECGLSALSLPVQGSGKI